MRGFKASKLQSHITRSHRGLAKPALSKILRSSRYYLHDERQQGHTIRFALRADLSLSEPQRASGQSLLVPLPSRPLSVGRLRRLALVDGHPRGRRHGGNFWVKVHERTWPRHADTLPDPPAWCRRNYLFDTDRFKILLDVREDRKCEAGLESCFGSSASSVPTQTASLSFDVKAKSSLAYPIKEVLDGRGRTSSWRLDWPPPPGPPSPPPQTACSASSAHPPSKARMPQRVSVSGGVDALVPCAPTARSGI
jgi:hypothetical protein